MLSRRIAIALVLWVVALAALQGLPTATATPTCSLYAASSGSDGADGSATTPFRTVQRLVDNLSPGQVGCLRKGVYEGELVGGDGYRQLKITAPRITLSSAPGEAAVIRGRVWIAGGANGAAVENLSLDGANSRELPSPSVDANATVFNHDEVTSRSGICFALGDYGYEIARGTVIEDSRIHDCGTPSSNQEHGIYVVSAYGTIIRHNWIYDNASRGIQLYPDAQATTITGNVIYGNGEGIIFSGNETTAASDTTATHNVIAGSTVRRNVESFYEPGAPIGTHNVVRANCIFGASSAYYGGADGSGLERPEVGFSATDNLARSPRFVDLRHGNLKLASSSPCATLTAKINVEGRRARRATGGLRVSNAVQVAPLRGG